MYKLKHICNSQIKESKLKIEVGRCVNEPVP